MVLGELLVELGQLGPLFVGQLAGRLRRRRGGFLTAIVARFGVPAVVAAVLGAGFGFAAVVVTHTLGGFAAITLGGCLGGLRVLFGAFFRHLFVLVHVRLFVLRHRR